MITVQSEEGSISQVQFRFRPPLTEQDICSFEKDIGYELPFDYRQFLKICNGCDLFSHPEYGGEAYLFGLRDIHEQSYEEPGEGFLKLGYFYGDNIVIDLNKVKVGDLNYLLVKDAIDHFYEARELHMNFELWLDRYIMCGGASFWNWHVYGADRYYQSKCQSE
ncbi:SMI1/KNR4 family protein [Paenibacillus sp. J5C_2022]|nr:SMI1/KNR4 family protein [Paenibacillus sp. J5C2022]